MLLRKLIHNQDEKKKDLEEQKKLQQQQQQQLEQQQSSLEQQLSRLDRTISQQQTGRRTALPMSTAVNTTEDPSAPSPPLLRPAVRLLTPTRRRNPPTKSLLRTLTPTKFRVAPVEDGGDEEEEEEEEETAGEKEGEEMKGTAVSVEGEPSVGAPAEPEEIGGDVGDVAPHLERPETTGLSRPGSNASRRHDGDATAEDAETEYEIENRDIYDKENFHEAESGTGSISPGGKARLMSGIGSRIGSARESRIGSRPVSASLPPIETPFEETMVKDEVDEEERSKAPVTLEKLKIPDKNEAEETEKDSPSVGDAGSAAAPTSPSSLPPSSISSPQDHRTTPEGDSHADDDENQQRHQQQLLDQQQQQSESETGKIALSNGFVPDGQLAVTA